MAQSFVSSLRHCVSQNPKSANPVTGQRTAIKKYNLSYKIINDTHNIIIMIRPTKVEPRLGYRIWIRYSDGVAGEIDLSHLAGCGVFSAWNERACFESVRVSENGAIVWSDELELCPDALYMQLTSKSVMQVM